MSNVLPLRARAESEAGRFPALMARADHLAATVLLGAHGRRRSGLGDDFWQYRPIQPGDSYRSIDWRRSGRGDSQFVREHEWQVAQSVQFWIDGAASMRFSSGTHETKADRARVLALAVAILLVRGGERVGLTGALLPPRRGDMQVTRLAQMLLQDDPADYGVPEARGLLPNARAVFISDFLGDARDVETALTKAADRGVRGVLVQVLDPCEEAFPFDGRTIFESAGGSVDHETLKAGDLRDRYLERLSERKRRLAAVAAVTGWRYHVHHTGDSAQSALLWMFRALEGQPP